MKMTHVQYDNEWNILSDRIEYMNATMHATIQRLANTTYAHPGDQLTDATQVGRCAESIKRAQGQMMLLNKEYNR